MAFDALRLRNVIQLIGILCQYVAIEFVGMRTHVLPTGFHGAMMVMAALQVHETRTALVQPPGASDYVVSSFLPSSPVQLIILHSQNSYVVS